MQIRNKIDNLLSNQKEVLKQYEDLISELNVNDSINENLLLKKEIGNYKKRLDEIDAQIKKLSQENISLRTALKEQILDEKIGILNASKKKIELYFSKDANSNINRLEALEKGTIDKLNNISKLAEKELNEDKEEIFSKIQEIRSELESKIQLKKQKMGNQKNTIIDELKREYDELKNEKISKEIIEKKRKHNDIEVKIGLNWINKVGIILLLLAVGTAMRYTYSTWFNGYMKGISGFILGALLLLGGEYLNRKNKNVFALGLCGGGVGVLYLSVFSSYFILQIVNMPISILMSILVTAVSLVLSQRYASMTICGISLVGGYLPFFSYAFFETLSGGQIYIAMIYLFILNLLVLALSFNRRWTYINYLSFILNIPCLVYLAFISKSELISIGYGILTFIMYLGITLIYPIREKIKLKIVDVVLLGLNTVTNCLLVYFLFEKAGYDSYKGLLALIYALSYLALGQVISKNTSQEKKTQALFYITAMTFAILMIPFQFGVKWTSLGWLIEALLVITYASRNKSKEMEIGGWSIFTLCFISFIVFDFCSWIEVQYFDLKYTLMVFGIIYLLTLYIPVLNGRELFRYTKKGRFLTYYKYFTIINTWFYLLRMTYRLYYRYVNLPYHYDNFYVSVLMALVTMLFAYGISKIPQIKDRIVNIISITLYIFTDLLCVSLNFFSHGSIENNTLRYLSIIILVVYNVFVFFNIKDLILKLIKNKGFSLEFYPLSLAIYLLGMVSFFLVYQFNLANINLMISLLFLSFSLVYIAYGFKRRFMMIRRFGLGLSIFSTGKLFVFDLSFLDTTGKIIAYFCFGIVLIGISFIYQRLKNTLDKHHSLND